MKSKSTNGSSRVIVLSFAATVALADCWARAEFKIAVDQGWYASNGFHDPGNTGYLTGRFSGFDYRGFAVFDLSTPISGTITTANLYLWNPAPGAPPNDTCGFVGDGFETLFVYDVTTPIGTLTAGGSGLTAIYTDLGSGTTYGARTVDASANGFFVVTSLSASFRAAVNAANNVGGQIAVGAAIGTIGGGNNQYIFGCGGCAGCAQLELIGSPDADNDEVPDSIDNCLTVANPGQQNSDGDALGDACDNCPGVTNPGQEDCDSDNLGDRCDGPDCNSNMITDSCDIASSTSSDCNVNAIPDECETAVCPYTLGPVTVNSGGLPSMSSLNDYELVASTGQSGGVGLVVSDGADYTSADGFWHAVYYCRPQVYGDIAPIGMPDGIVEIGDVLCMLDGYNNQSACPDSDIAPCIPDGITELGDVLAILDAYGGIYLCAGPCI